MTAAPFDTRPCTLGEGPLWHPERNALFWFDITGCRLLSRAGDGGGESAWDWGEPVSAAGWVDRDSLLVASQTGLYRFDIASGARERIVALEADNPATRSNDGRADPMGGFWIGTMGKRAEPGAGAIYRYYRGALERLHGAITIPNAICFAPDGRRAYFTDTASGRIMAQPLDTEGWPAGAAVVFVDLRPEGLHPDGAVVDAAGGLWNAQWGAGRVARYTPDGRFDRAIALPAPLVTCPAFGGADLRQMFVTSAREGLDADALARAPLSGQTFGLLPGAQGLREPRVLL